MSSKCTAIRSRIDQPYNNGYNVLKSQSDSLNYTAQELIEAQTTANLIML